MSTGINTDISTPCVVGNLWSKCTKPYFCLFAGNATETSILSTI